MIEKDAKRYKEFCNHVEGYGAFSPWLDEYDPFTETGLAFVHGGSEDNGQFGLGDIDLGFGKVDFTYQDVLEKVKAYRDECKGQMDPDFPEECEYVDELDELVRALTDWCNENESKKSESGDALKKVVDAASAALNNYDSDNVDVIEDEETGELVVMFHSSKTSHPITNTGVYADDVDLRKLEKELDKLTVGYMFESKKSEAAEDALVSKATDYIMRNAKRANVSISITPIDNTKDYVGFEIDGVTVHGLPAYISVYFNRDDGSVNNLAFFNNDPTLNKGSDVDIMVDAPIFEKDPARVFNEFLRQADSSNENTKGSVSKKPESKKSEAFGDSIKMNIDYETFKRLCSTAAYLDSDEDYWDALWDYYSEMGEVSGSALEFFDNLFQYTDWADEERVYDEILDDKYKDDNKTKEQCIEAAIDDGDLNAYKHSSGNYLIVQ